MAVEGLDAALPIEGPQFLPVTLGETAEPELAPTLDDMLRSAAQTGADPSSFGTPALGDEAMREVLVADLWVGNQPGPVEREWAIVRTHHESALSFEPGTFDGFGSGTTGGKDVGLTPMSLEDWNEVPEFDEQYFQEVSNWYAFGSIGYDEFSDRLEEWGRQMTEWVWSVIPGGQGPEIVVTAPSGMDIGNDMRIIFHHDGSGLISLFQNGEFVTGLQATIPGHHDLVVTIAPTNYQGGVNTPRGGIEGQTSGGTTTTFYFRYGP